MQGAHVREVKLLEVGLEVDFALEDEELRLESDELGRAGRERPVPEDRAADVARPARAVG